MQDKEKPTAIDPDLYKKQKEERKKNKQKEEKIKPQYEEKEFTNRGNSTRMTLSSEGRFSLNGTLYFEGWRDDHLMDLSLIQDEADLPETLIAILDELKADDEIDPVSIANATADEIIEILINMKQAYSPEEAHNHEHRWICECQDHLPEHLKKINNEIVDLYTLNFRSMSEMDDEFIKDTVKPRLESMDNTQWNRYKQVAEIDESFSKEDFISNFKIKDKINLFDTETQTKYTFIFPRFGHILKGYKMANEEFKWEIEKIRNKKASNEDEALRQQDKLKEIQNKRAKKALKYIRKLALYSINDKIIEKDEEKVKTEVPGQIFDQLVSYQNYIDYGLHNEREFVCPLCGKTDRRLLQQFIGPLELLPIVHNDSSVHTKNKPRSTDRIEVFFG